MRVVVTGGTGHIGCNLVRTLLEQGDEVRVLLQGSQPPASLAGLDVEYCPGDVRDVDTMRRAFAGRQRLYHLAAIISISGDHGGLVPAVNVEGARNAAQAALESGIERMVHFCSVHAFRQDPLDQVLDESRSRVPPQGGDHPAYDRSKAAGELAVREFLSKGLDIVLVHPTGVIGPNDYEPSRMGRLFLDLFHRRMPSLIEGGFDWVDVRDVVDAAIAAGDRGLSGESYLLSGNWRSVDALAAICSQITGVRSPALTTPMWLARAAAPFSLAYADLSGREPLFTPESLAALRANRTLSYEKATHAWGYSPRSVEESVLDIYTSFQDRGMLERPVTLRPPQHSAV